MNKIINLGIETKYIKKISYQENFITIYFKDNNNLKHYSLFYKNQGVAQDKFINLLIALDVKEQFGFFKSAEWTPEKGLKIM